MHQCRGQNGVSIVAEVIVVARAQAAVVVGGGESGKTAGGEKTRWQAE